MPAALLLCPSPPPPHFKFLVFFSPWTCIASELDAGSSAVLAGRGLATKNQLNNQTLHLHHHHHRLSCRLETLSVECDSVFHATGLPSSFAAVVKGPGHDWTDWNKSAPNKAASSSFHLHLRRRSSRVHGVTAGRRSRFGPAASASARRLLLQQQII